MSADATQEPTEFPPWLLTRERDVLAWALERGIVAPIDAPALFCRHAHTVIWASILRLTTQQKSCDYLTVRADLERRGELDAVGGQSYLLDVARESVKPSDAALTTAAAEIITAGKQRRVREVLRRYAQEPDVPVTDVIIEHLRRIEGACSLDLPQFQTLRDVLAEPDDPVRWRLAQWQPKGAHVLLTAQFKAGKTTLVGNLLRSLVDGDPWLGRDVVEPVASVVVIDCEMNKTQGKSWLGAQRIEHDDRIHLLYLRGRASSFDIMQPAIRAQWAAQLRNVHAEYLILDCARPMLDTFGLSEDKEAGRFLVAFDALMEEANIPDGVLVHHMGHNGERARGDSRFRDWADVEWRLVRKDEDPSSPRYITAYGRDVDVPESQLLFDSLGRRLSIEQGSRKDAAARDALELVLGVLDGAEDALSGRAIKAALKDSETPRATIEGALDYGVRTGALLEHQGLRNAHLYRRNPTSVPSVPPPSQNGEVECPGAYISRDTRTLTPALSDEMNSGTLESASEVALERF
jgi:hypothetical protein